MQNALAKGANAQVPSQTLIIVATHAGANTDLSAIMLTAAGKVRTEADFVFYGQTASPEGSVKYTNKVQSGTTYKHSLSIDLPAVPAEIERIELTLTIDPETNATFAAVKDAKFSVCDASGAELVSFVPEGGVENAFIVGELYRRNGTWKVRHVAQGYTGGLAAIATAFGIEIAAEEPAAPAATPAKTTHKVNLSKSDQVTAELERKGSRLVSLQKAAAVSLKKHKVDGIVARVVMVLDASGSTSRMWPNTMQGVTDRLATLALNLDDNGELEFWVYATGYKKFAVVKLSNLDGYIASLQRGEDGSGTPPAAAPAQKKGLLGGLFGGGSSGGGSIFGNGLVPGLGYDNNEPPVMQAILDECKVSKSGSTLIPTLVLFVTDGGIDKDRAIEKVLTEASHHPIFWQFIGLGGSSYGVLEQLDTMTGRKVDNAGFFAIDDYNSIADEELYSRIIKEFPKWLEKVRGLGMLP